MIRTTNSLAAFALFVLLAVIHTWPLASAPARLSRNDNSDTMLNEWTIAWVAHQAPRHPLHLFDANIFYPNQGTLAYSEHLLVPAAMGAPLFWLGASPVLVYNLLLMAGFALTGWAGWYAMTRWTGDWWAGAVTGTMLAFNAHTLTRLPHLQALHGEFLPLALVAFDDLLNAPQQRTALRLAGWFVLQSLTSFYTLVFSTIALAVGGLVRPEDWTGRQLKRLLPPLFLSAGLAVVLVVPFLLPYRRTGLTRPLDEVALFSAAWRDYLTTPARVHYGTWSARWFGGTGLFPGFVGVLLTLLAVVSGTAFTDRRARMATVFGLAGFALSFGPAFPGYALLYRAVPLLQGIRGAARFGYLVIVAVALLSGFAVARMRATWNHAKWTTTTAIALVALANLDALAAPIAYVTPEPIAKIYTQLGSTPSVVAEFPFPPPDRVFRNAPYLLNSTRHWQPMLNGYSGLTPASYVLQYEELRGFPDVRSIAALQRLGVTSVFVHYAALESTSGTSAIEAIRRSKDLQLMADDGAIGLYAVKSAGGPS